MPPHCESSSSSSCRRERADEEIVTMKPPVAPTTTTHHRRSDSIGNQSLDNKSAGSGSAAAPSSVYLAGPPITRELSDLSGSYVNGSSSRGGRGAVPAQIFDQAFFNKGPWRQGYVLSQMPPSSSFSSPSPPRQPANPEHIITSNRTATVFVSQNEDSHGVEIINDLISGELNLLTSSSPSIQNNNNNRIPIIVLLMDTSKKSYELMQIWVDRSTDSVRDVVQTLHHSIPDKWKLDYDGIFQMRGNRFTQLINILSLEKYDAQPYELWIAKPWSMTAKVTIGFATSCIRHLTSLGIVCTDDEERPGTFRPKSAEAALVLTKTAQSRLFVEDGIVMKHHHAVQFVSLSPPMDVKNSNNNNNTTYHSVDHDRDDAHSSVTGGSFQLSTSSTDQRVRTSSSNNNNDLTNPMERPLSPISVGNTFSSLPSSPGSPSVRKKPQHHFHLDSVEETTSDGPRQSPGKSNSKSKTKKSGSLGKLVSSLNCCRSSSGNKKDKNECPSLLLRHQTTNTSQLTTLTEEQEQQWASFEPANPSHHQSYQYNNSHHHPNHHSGDISLAGSGTRSIVSMSAPLLKVGVSSSSVSHADHSFGRF